MPGKVVALHRKPEKGVLEPVPALSAVAGAGLEGDHFFGHSERQVLFVSSESLNQLGLNPGDLREQITVDLPGLQELPPGTEIRVGPTSFRIESDCAPCAHMAKRLGEDADEFKARSTGKRGMFTKVAIGGTVRIGDEVSVVTS